MNQLYKAEAITLSMRQNLKFHEHMGLFLVFAGASWLGFGLYITMLSANRLLIPGAQLLAGRELFMIPLFYGVGAIVLLLGTIELREALPGKNR